MAFLYDYGEQFIDLLVEGLFAHWIMLILSIGFACFIQVWVVLGRVLCRFIGILAILRRNCLLAITLTSRLLIHTYCCYVIRSNYYYVIHTYYYFVFNFCDYIFHSYD